MLRICYQTRNPCRHFGQGWNTTEAHVFFFLSMFVSVTYQLTLHFMTYRAKRSTIYQLQFLNYSNFSERSYIRMSKLTLSSREFWRQGKETKTEVTKAKSSLSNVFIFGKWRTIIVIIHVNVTSFEFSQKPITFVLECIIKWPVWGVVR